MRVVRVSARTDYEGISWTALFSSVDRAVEFLRHGDADGFGGIDDIDVAWVGVDSDDVYERILSFEVNYYWAEEKSVMFNGCDREAFDYSA